jgi:hypothetical protein
MAPQVAAGAPHHSLAARIMQRLSAASLGHHAARASATRQPAPSARIVRSDAERDQMITAHVAALSGNVFHPYRDFDGNGGAADDGAERLSVIRTDAGFVVHVSNTGPTGGRHQRCTERHPGDWVSYDDTPGD